MPRSDTVFVEINGLILTNWLDYEIDSDLMIPADDWSMRCALRGSDAQMREWREKIVDGATMRLYVGEDVTGRTPRAHYLQHTGIVDQRTFSASHEDGTIVEIKGRDLAAHLVDNSVHPSLYRAAGTNLLALAAAACAEHSIPVIADPSASRMITSGSAASTPGRADRDAARQHGIPQEEWSLELRRRAQREGRPYDELVQDTPALERARGRARRRSASGQTPSDVERLTAREAKPHDGESAWEFIERHVQRFGLMMWMSPRGELIIAPPTYDQQPRFKVTRRYASRVDDENNVLVGSYTSNAADRYSEVLLFGRTRGNDIERAAIRAVARDTDPATDASFSRPQPLPFVRRLVVHDNDITTQAEADRRARRVLNEHAATADVFHATLLGHGQREHIFAVDTIASLVDEISGLTAVAPWYVTKRTFHKSRSHGTTTTLRLVPRGRIVL